MLIHVHIVGLCHLMVFLLANIYSSAQQEQIKEELKGGESAEDKQKGRQSVFGTSHQETVPNMCEVEILG